MKAEKVIPTIQDKQIYVCIGYCEREDGKGDWVINSIFYYVDESNVASAFKRGNCRVFAFPQMKEITEVDINFKMEK